MKSIKGLLYAVVSSSTFGLVPLFAIPALKAGVPVNSVVFYRFAFSALLVGFVLLIKRESLRIEKRQFPVIAGFAFLYAATSFLLTQSYLYIPSGLATTLHFLYPVLVTILMVAFFKERLSIPVVVATLLALGGIYLLSGSNGGEFNPTGMTLALTTVLTYASYIVGLNRSSVSRIDSLKLTFYILTPPAASSSWPTCWYEAKGRPLSPPGRQASTSSCWHWCLPLSPTSPLSWL